MRRHVMRIAVCVVIGVVVNVLVAWGIAWRGGTLTMDMSEVPLVDANRFRFEIDLCGPAVEVTRFGGLPAGVSARIVTLSRMSRSEWDSIDIRQRSKGGSVLVGSLSVSDVGLPMRSLTGMMMTFQGPGAQEAERAWEKSSWWKRGLRIPALERSPGLGLEYPILPIWPGFVVNTLVYGALAWGVLFAPGVVKRWRRRRRGACVGCGYELAGLVRCPECGSEVL